MELLINPVPGKPGIYQAHYDDTLLCTSRIPFFDGARALIKLGHSPCSPLTLCHAGKDYVSIRSSIGEAAKYTVIENGKTGPRLRKYEPNTFLKSKQDLARQAAV